MSIREMKKTCLQCGREFSFNPDVGKWRCPRCSRKSPGMTMGGHGRSVLPRGFLERWDKIASDYPEWRKQKPVHN